MLLAQLDDDPALEIVVDGNPLMVVDGATHATDWSFDDIYNECCLVAGHFQDGNVGQFVAARGYAYMSLFQASPYALDWSAEPRGVAALASADLDHDGYDEVIEADTQWGSINVLDGRTRTLDLSVQNPAWGVRALTAVDLQGNGHPAIAFTSGQPDYPYDVVMQIVDGIDGSTLWQLLNAQPGPYAPVALVDANGDGRRELYYASIGAFEDGSVSALDATAGSLLWKSDSSALNPEGPFSFNPISMQGVPCENGSPLIVVAGMNSYGGRMIGFDSLDHHVIWQAPVDGSGVLVFGP